MSNLASWFLFVLAALVIVMPVLLALLSGGGRSFFNVPYITWYLLHYTVAALGLTAVVTLGLTGTLDKEGIAALLGSLFGYVLGSVAHRQETIGPGRPPLTITTPSPLPQASLNQPYPPQHLGAFGGIPPYSWELTPGSSLPEGLTLDQSQGILSGTPTAAGIAQFAVRVTDGAQATAERVLRLSVS